jgi:hypothetical protein
VSNSYTIDFQKVQRGFRGYSSGSLRLQSILYGGEYYLLKYPEKNKKKTHEFQVSSYINNSLSEHIGCRIFEAAGISAQKTLLGKIGADIVVACKDFVDRDSHNELHEFSTVSKELYSSSEVGRYPSINRIYEVISSHPVLSGIKNESIRSYWDMQIIDALIGNFDRHTGNWGYIINTKTGKATPSPIYDCGSSLWAKIDDSAIDDILSSHVHLEKLIYDLPKGKIKLHENSARQGYYDFFKSKVDSNCTEALIRLVPMIDLVKINKVIDETPYISPRRSALLKKVLAGRYENILYKAYEVLR